MNTGPARLRKLRGWRRRLRALDRWADDHAALDVDALHASGYHSAEIWFEHWPRPWPPSIRRRMVHHLARIHDAWLPPLQQLGEPFYLGIWLFEPDLAESQVVAAVGERAAEYAALHADAPGSAPPALYDGPADLRRFAWTRRTWAEPADAQAGGSARYDVWRARLRERRPAQSGDGG